MKKILFLLPVAALILTTGCDANKKNTKKLNCSMSLGTMESIVELTFEDDKIVEANGSMILVFNSEEEANAFDNTGDFTISGAEIEKREGSKVTLKMTKEGMDESIKEYDGMSYNEVKEALEQTGAVCK